MEYKKIKIFLASSIAELKSERYELSDFIYSLGSKFRESYNIDVVPFICENFDHAITKGGRMQDEFNKEIRNSDMVFFIFFTHIGQYTEEEFAVAWDAFQNSAEDKPKIYTYFKALADGEKMEDELRGFMKNLDETIGHYHETFVSLDTIKLRIVLNLKMQEMNFLKVETKDGKCYIDGREMPKSDLNLDNVSEFANNKFLSELKTELAQVEEKYFELKPIYAKGGCDDDFYKEYSQIASKRQSLIDSVGELQKNIFNMSLNMSRDDVRGEITARQKEAYRLFERGDYEGALAILDAADIDSEYEAYMKNLEKMQKEAAVKYIREHKTAIDILCAMTKYDGRFAEIQSRYEKIVPEAEKYQVEMHTVYDYADWLNKQNHQKESIAVCERLIKNYSKENNPAFYAKVCNLLGKLYQKTNRMKESETLLTESLEIRRELAKDGSDECNADLAETCDNLARLYKINNRMKEAETLYQEAIRIYDFLAKNKSEIYSSKFAHLCNEFAVFFLDIKQFYRAEDLLNKSLKIRKQLAYTDSDRYNYDLSESLNNISIVYRETDRFDEALSAIEESYRIMKDLDKENPDAYENDLALICINKGSLYQITNRIDEAEKLLREAVLITKRLSYVNPDVYKKDLAIAYNNLGCFLSENNRISESVTALNNSVRISKELAAENPQVYNSFLATHYNNLGESYYYLNEVDKSISVCLESLQIRKKLAQQVPNVYDADLAESYSSLGALYIVTSRKDEARTLLNEALKIYQQLDRQGGNYSDKINDITKILNNI